MVRYFRPEYRADLAALAMLDLLSRGFLGRASGPGWQILVNAMKHLNIRILGGVPYRTVAERSSVPDEGAEGGGLTIRSRA